MNTSINFEKYIYKSNVKWHNSFIKQPLYISLKQSIIQKIFFLSSLEMFFKYNLKLKNKLKKIIQYIYKFYFLILFFNFKLKIFLMYNLLKFKKDKQYLLLPIDYFLLNFNKTILNLFSLESFKFCTEIPNIILKNKNKINNNKNTKIKYVKQIINNLNNFNKMKYYYSIKNYKKVNEYICKIENSRIIKKKKKIKKKKLIKYIRSLFKNNNKKGVRIKKVLKLKKYLYIRKPLKKKISVFNLSKFNQIKLLKNIEKLKKKYFFKIKIHKRKTKRKKKKRVRKLKIEKKKPVKKLKIEKKNILNIGFKKKGRLRKVGYLYHISTRRNLKLTFKDFNGKVLRYFSCGTHRKYKKARRREKDIRYKTTFKMTKEIGRLRYKRVIVVFKGLFTFNIRKVLKRRRVKVISYLFDFLKPHNGCRKPNKKRK